MSEHSPTILQSKVDPDSSTQVATVFVDEHGNRIPQPTTLAHITGAGVGGELAFSQADIEVVKNTIAKGATDNELRMFLFLCEKYGLDPFLGEAWCYKRPSSGQKMEDATAIIGPSVAGRLKHASRDPHYCGPPSYGVHRQGDMLKLDWANAEVRHVSENMSAPIVGAWARMQHAVHGPRLFYVPMQEAKTGGPPWKTSPAKMIVKAAIELVVRHLYPMGDLLGQDEARVILGIDEKMDEKEVLAGAYVSATPVVTEGQTGFFGAKPVRVDPETGLPEGTFVSDGEAAERLTLAAKALLEAKGYNTEGVNRKALEFFGEEQEFVLNAIGADWKGEPGEGEERDPLGLLHLMGVRVMDTVGFLEFVYDPDGTQSLEDFKACAEKLVASATAPVE